MATASQAVDEEQAETEAEAAAELEALTGAEFLELCGELGYRPLPWWGGGYLLACVKPDDVTRFAGCARRPFPPEGASNPERVAFEIEWHG